MPRRQQSAADDLFDMMKVMPIWVGPILAVVAYIVIRFLIPLSLPVPKNAGDPVVMWRSLVMMCSWLVPVVILMVWTGAEVWKLMNRNLLNRLTGMGSIRDISWREFERLVGEAYRRKGYIAEVVGTDSGDGGVDIRLTGHGETVLIQCKQWKAYKVGVTTVRELLGVVVSEKADRGIVVTSGRFTQESRSFAHQNSKIELVDGAGLAELVRGVQVGAARLPLQNPMQAAAPVAPSCPLCGTQMVVRTARKGQNAGSQFWGCPKYPGCKGTRQW